MSAVFSDGSKSTDHWARLPLAEIAEVFTDGNWIESKDQAQSGIRLVQTGNVGVGTFKDRRDKARFIDEETFRRLSCIEVLPGDVLVSRLPDPVGRACIIPVTGDKMITAVDCSIIRTDDAVIDTDFLVYYTQTKEYLQAVDAHCTGTTRRRISRKNLGKVSVPVPPLDEQKRIVAVLDQAFAALDRARANDLENVTDTSELLNSYERFSTEDRSDWSTCEIRHLLKVKSGDFLPKKAMNSEGRIPVIGGNGQNGYHDQANLTGNNIVIGRVGAKCGNVHLIAGPIWLTDNAFSVTDTYQDFDLEFLATTLNRADLRKVATQAAQPVISGKTIGPVELTFPKSLEEQKRYVEKTKLRAERANSLKMLYENRLNNLDSLRTSLLAKAFSGELA